MIELLLANATLADPAVADAAVTQVAAVQQAAANAPIADVAEHARILANEFLTWIGFGTCAGLAAKAIMPGRDPGGAIATLLMGIGGAVIGGGVLMYFTGGTKIQPVSLMGFVVATGGAFLLLFFYKLLGGRIIREGDRGVRVVGQPQYTRRRKRRSVVVED
jgi:uncharacterized membrane protein YeaQ/YmgE (transglycosylase-associated protein family)